MRNNFIYTRIKEGIFQRKIEDQKKNFIPHVTDTKLLLKI